MSSSSASEGLMADPYAASSTAALPPPPSTPSAPPSLPSGWAATPGLDGGSAATPDYLFETDVDPTFRRSWGERLTFHVGGAYLLGPCLRLTRLRPNIRAHSLSTRDARESAAEVLPLY
jgi:hypothetical protein